MTIRYEITNEVGDEHAQAVADFMTQRHLPDAWATGCFTSISWEQSGPGRFRGVFTAASREDLDRYFADHAPRLAEDARAHMPHAGVPERAEWTVLQTWE